MARILVFGITLSLFAFLCFLCSKTWYSLRLTMVITSLAVFLPLFAGQVFNTAERKIEVEHVCPLPQHCLKGVITPREVGLYWYPLVVSARQTTSVAV